MRASGSGTRIGRPSKAAVATATTEPDTNPAGKPSNVNVRPPASAIASVSAVSIRMRRNAGFMARADNWPIPDHECRQHPCSSTWAERPAVLIDTPAKLCDPRHGSTQDAGEGEVMLQGWVIVAIALAYIGLLFLVASYGDRRRITRASSARLLIYPLSL